MYNFVAPKKIADIFKKSKWFKIYLGHNVSVRDSKTDQTKFEINDKDTFIKYYFDKFKVLILSEGSIGSINFFTDYYITDEIIAVHYKDKEFIIKYEADKLKAGVDDYIGSIIKDIQLEYSSELGKAEAIKISKVVDPTKIYKNPGSVTWEDVLAMKKKQKEK